MLLPVGIRGEQLAPWAGFNRRLNVARPAVPPGPTASVEWPRALIPAFIPLNSREHRDDSSERPETPYTRSRPHGARTVTV